MSDKRLFPQPLPIVVITGEYESGKTLAILTTGYPEDRTLLYDNEQSATLYEVVGNFTSGGTESNNQAIKSIAGARYARKQEVHVLLQLLERFGAIPPAIGEQDATHHLEPLPLEHVFGPSQTDAIGTRILEIPITPEKILRALGKL